MHMLRVERLHVAVAAALLAYLARTSNLLRVCSRGASPLRAPVKLRIAFPFISYASKVADASFTAIGPLPADTDRDL